MITKPFSYYLENRKIKKKTPDPEEGKALLSKAKQRLTYVKSQELTEMSCDFLFEDAYETAREAAQSLMSLKGYKPYSHEGTIAFIGEFFSNFSKEELNNFDRFRLMRHSLAYGGKDILLEEAKEAIEFASGFLKKIENEWEAAQSKGA